jgi:transcriptional regulator with XRE-family HTH domain
MSTMTGSAPTLGSLLRAVRERHGWTLKEMSDRTGIPRSTLAKVEHDRLTLGYDKLLQISQRLKMRLSELISAGDEAEPRTLTRRSIGTVANALRVETPHYEYFFMCPDLRRKKMVPIFGRLRAKTLEEFGELMRHAGEEFVFILTGRVQVITEFYEPAVLEAGQCAYIDSGMGHAYLLAPGCEEATLVAGCTSDDENLIDSLKSSKPAEKRDAGRATERPEKPARKASRQKAHRR